jgi:Fe-S cluster biogenesis protein NfuA
MDQRLKVVEVLDAMNSLVARDGGAIELTSYSPSAVQVRYTLGKNDECDTCMITPEMLKDFLLEGFRSHELTVQDVRVDPA